MAAFAGVDAQKRVQRAEDDGRGEHRDEVQESSGSVEGGAQTPEGEADEKADGAMGKAGVGLHECKDGGGFGNLDGLNKGPSLRDSDVAVFAREDSICGSMQVVVGSVGWF